MKFPLLACPCTEAKRKSTKVQAQAPISIAHNQSPIFEQRKSILQQGLWSRLLVLLSQIPALTLCVFLHTYLQSTVLLSAACCIFVHCAGEVPELQMIKLKWSSAPDFNNPPETRQGCRWSHEGDCVAHWPESEAAVVWCPRTPYDADAPGSASCPRMAVPLHRRAPGPLLACGRHRMRTV